MKTEPTQPSPEIPDLESNRLDPTIYTDSIRNFDCAKEAISAESRLAEKIFREANGRVLIKFCRELSGVIIRRYIVENDAAIVKRKTADSLVKTLHCSEQQADCLVDLSMELIHAKIHGTYHRSNIELSYLIATATGAVKDITVN
ncbi:MAG: hypothetical protein P1V20_00415 [Verrucomicrobiales bacterium]|nr:hypothetical protein [Verrucomicrobiales bacterium]